MTTKPVEPVEESAEEAKEAPKQTVKIEVSDLGMKLPIGTGPLDGSTARNTSLAFRDWTAKDERALGKMRQKNPSMSDAGLVTQVIGDFATKWGKHNFEKKTKAEKEMIVQTSPAADVFHAWCLLRVENVGGDFRMTFPCPYCRKTIVFDMDIEKIEEHVPVSPTTDLIRVIEARKGPMFKGERRKKLRMAPVPWKMQEKVSDSATMDMSELKLLYIEASTIGLDGIDGDIVLPPTSVDSLVKYDIEFLAAHVDDNQLGPDLSINFDCPHCAGRIVRPVVWEYDIFFSVPGSGR